MSVVDRAEKETKKRARRSLRRELAKRLSRLSKIVRKRMRRVRKRFRRLSSLKALRRWRRRNVQRLFWPPLLYLITRPTDPRDRLLRAGPVDRLPTGGLEIQQGELLDAPEAEPEQASQGR